jgi:formate-dependent phosphoribosylglycinamide formyltransferase (GAR transformylase)
MAKVLLVDTNFSSVPIYQSLCNMGHEVHVVGGNPVDCLAKSVANYWNINYADTKALGELVDSEGFEFIVPGCTDRSYASCVAINNGRFPGIESMDVDLAINNKARFREIAKQLHLPVPQVQELGSLRWPLIVKPVDSFSGKGITVIPKEDHEALQRAIDDARNASARGEFLIEDFVTGTLHSHSAFLCDSKVAKDFVVQENGTVNPFVVDTSRVVFTPPDTVLKKLRNAIGTLATELGLQDGLLHTQFILDGDNIHLIEMTRRCPGDLYSQLIELSTGFKYVDAYVRSFVGMTVRWHEEGLSNRAIMRHTLTVNTYQSLGYVQFMRDIKIERWIPLSLVGDQLKPSPASRIAVIFASALDEVDFNAMYTATLEHNLYKLAV